MNDPSDWLRRPAAPRRNNFYFGKMMGVAQFEREQRYGMGQRWLMNRLTLGTGILSGLAVEVTSDGRRIQVAAGVAVDSWGREIIVARPTVEYDPFAPGGGCGCSDEPAIDKAGVYTLYLRYRECTADERLVSYDEDCPGQPDCPPDTTIETFSLALRSDPSSVKAFDCAAWSAPEPAPASPADAVLTSALLRKRLAGQFAGASGQLPADPWVPLGLFTVTELADKSLTLSLNTSSDPRVYIHSQAQLLDALLCLAETVAKCCETQPPPLPPTIDPPTVTALRFLRLEAAQLVEVVPRPGTAPPVFDAREDPPGSGKWDPIHLRTSFSKPIDGANITSPANQPRGFEVTVAPLGGGVPATAAVEARLESADTVVLVECPGDPGAYALTLRGAPASPSQTPIVSSDPDLGKRRRLDGEFRSQLPSGDTIEGGDFVYAFQIREPAKTFRIDRIELMNGQLVMQTLITKQATSLSPRRPCDRFRVVFNAPVDVASATVPGAVTVTLAGAPVEGIIVVDPDVNSFVFRITRYLANPVELFPSGNHEVKLSGAMIRDVPPAGAAARLLDGEARVQDPPLPSGDGVDGGDFTFNFTVM